MIQRNEIGKKIRKYLIEIEKNWRQSISTQDSYLIEDSIERAKRWIEED